MLTEPLIQQLHALRLQGMACHLSAYRSHWVFGIKEPGDFRHIGATFA